MKEFRPHMPTQIFSPRFKTTVIPKSTYADWPDYFKKLAKSIDPLLKIGY
jgi:hypothetical protein